jgi:hypothetical protein
MPSRVRKFSGAAIQRRIKKGHGQGQGPNYVPWFFISEVPSGGTSSQIEGRPHNRERHLLSQNEARYYFALSWSDVIVDIREQFPLLPIEDTLEIASYLGFKHPPEKKKEPEVMTTDFMLTIMRDGKLHYAVRTVKEIKDLCQPRTLELLEIERQYFHYHGIDDWGIVTDIELAMPEIDGINSIHESREFWNLAPMTQEEVKRIAVVLSSRVKSRGSVRLSPLCSDLDPKARVYFSECKELEEALIAGKAAEESDPYADLQRPGFLFSRARCKERDQNYEAMKDLFEATPEERFSRKGRAKIIKDIAGRDRQSPLYRSKVYANVLWRRYCQRGQNINALLSDRDKGGWRKEQRAKRAPATRPGRRKTGETKDQSNQRFIVTEKHAETLYRIGCLYYRKRQKNGKRRTWKEALQLGCEKFFSRGWRKNEQGTRVPDLPPKRLLPSVRQLRHHYLQRSRLGVPILMVGTYKAKRILYDQFRLARRSCGAGMSEWLPLQKKGEWEVVTKALWNYQFTRTPIEWTEKLVDALYEESQGITDVAVKLFMLAQQKVILRKLELVA